jgi:hypothetical protein
VLGVAIWQLGPRQFGRDPPLPFNPDADWTLAFITVTRVDFYAGYDALWEQETPHERVEQFGTRVMRHERPWTRQRWINAA